MENKIDIKKLFYVLFAFVCFIFIPNFVKYLHGCFNTWDFGIFVEATQKLGWNQLNPLINSYGFKIFNDHFDPILFLPTFLNQLFPSSVSLLGTELLFVLLSILPIYLLNKKNKLETNLSWFLIIYILINKAIITALFYPVHPTTWTVAVLAFMFYFAYEKKYLSLFVSTVLLFFFKEEFPFVGIMTSFYFLYEHRKNKLSLTYFFTLLFISVAWLIFAVKIRPIWFGGAFNDHGGNFLNGLISNPLSVLNEYDFSKLKLIASCFLPVLLVFFFNKENLKKVFWPAIFMTTPMIALRLLSGKFGFQYTAPFVIPFAFLLLNKDFKLSTKQLSLTIVLMLIFSGFTIFKEVFFVAKGITKSGCALDSNRRTAIEQIVQFDYATSCKEVFATGGAAFTLSTHKIYPKIIGPKGSDLPPESCIVLDVKSGDPYPRSSKDVQDFSLKFPTIFSNSDFILLKTHPLNKSQD